MLRRVSVSHDSRREFVRSTLAATAAGVAGLAPLAACVRVASAAMLVESPVRNGGTGTIRHSACRWCYRDIPLDDLAAAAKSMGLESVELLEPEEFDTVRKHGLVCAMTNAPGDPRTRLTKGFNRVDNHSWLIPLYTQHIDKVARAGFPNLICFSGNRDGLGDAEGMEHCAIGLRALTPIAERAGVTLCMELLNSKVDHHDYQCDHTAWGVSLVQRVASPRFRLLYDIYHMQIMEGDVIRTIRDNHQHIAHFHTGGVPGRHEIDESQELTYPAIMRAIADTGFTGFVAQEFVPTRAPLSSLADAVRRCTV
ncbi:MAG: hydroxypyruvate isomerase [Gemmatimonadetes bacterium]|jgi:hydroxypyruvate isomerase|nr:hydroxypyruvate isomerase [Gemmatimonadota bacterium]